MMIRQCDNCVGRFPQVKVTKRYLSLPKKEDRLRASILLGGPVITFCLGIWQIKRLFWKREILDRLERSKVQEPLTFDLIGDEEDFEQIISKFQEYSRVKVKGRFDHSREVYIRPRPQVDSKGTATSNSGALVITPFILSANEYGPGVRGTWILVNRGWVDFKQLKPESRPQGQITDEVELVGVVRKSEPKMNRLIAGHVKDDKNLLWSQRNIELMSSVLGTSGLFIDAEASSTIPGGPIAGQTIYSIRNEHLSYILTWFGLCMGTSYIWFKTFLR